MQERVIRYLAEHPPPRLKMMSEISRRNPTCSADRIIQVEAAAGTRGSVTCSGHPLSLPAQMTLLHQIVVHKQLVAIMEHKELVANLVLEQLAAWCNGGLAQV